MNDQSVGGISLIEDVSTTTEPSFSPSRQYEESKQEMTDDKVLYESQPQDIEPCLFSSAKTFRFRQCLLWTAEELHRYQAAHKEKEMKVSELVVQNHELVRAKEELVQQQVLKEKEHEQRLQQLHQGYEEKLHRADAHTTPTTEKVKLLQELLSRNKEEMKQMQMISFQQEKLISELQSKLGSQVSSWRLVETKWTQLDTQLSQLKAEYTAATESLAKLEAAVEQTRVVSHGLTHQAKHHQRLLEDKTSLVVSLTQEVVTLKTSLAGRPEQSHEVDHLQLTVDSLRKQVIELEGQRDDLSLELTRVSQRAQEAMTSSQTAHSQIACHLNISERHRLENARLTTQLEEITSRHKIIQTKLMLSQQAWDKEREMSRKEKLKWVEKVQIITKEMKDKDDILAANRERLADVQQQKAQLCLELDNTSIQLMQAKELLNVPRADLSIQCGCSFSLTSSVYVEVCPESMTSDTQTTISPACDNYQQTDQVISSNIQTQTTSAVLLEAHAQTMSAQLESRGVSTDFHPPTVPKYCQTNTPKPKCCHMVTQTYQSSYTKIHMTKYDFDDNKMQCAMTSGYSVGGVGSQLTVENDMNYSNETLDQRRFVGSKSLCTSNILSGYSSDTKIPSGSKHFQENINMSGGNGNQVQSLHMQTADKNIIESLTAPVNWCPQASTCNQTIEEKHSGTIELSELYKETEQTRDKAVARDSVSSCDTNEDGQTSSSYVAMQDKGPVVQPAPVKYQSTGLAYHHERKFAFIKSADGSRVQIGPLYSPAGTVASPRDVSPQQCVPRPYSDPHFSGCDKKSVQSSVSSCESNIINHSQSHKSIIDRNSGLNNDRLDSNNRTDTSNCTGQKEGSNRKNTKISIENEQNIKKHLKRLENPNISAFMKTSQALQRRKHSNSIGRCGALSLKQSKGKQLNPFGLSSSLTQPSHCEHSVVQCSQEEQTSKHLIGSRVDHSQATPTSNTTMSVINNIDLTVASDYPLTQKRDVPDTKTERRDFNNKPDKKTHGLYDLHKIKQSRSVEVTKKHKRRERSAPLFEPNQMYEPINYKQESVLHDVGRFQCIPHVMVKKTKGKKTKGILKGPGINKRHGSTRKSVKFPEQLEVLLCTPEKAYKALSHPVPCMTNSTDTLSEASSDPTQPDSKQLPLSQLEQAQAQPANQASDLCNLPSQSANLAKSLVNKKKDDGLSDQIIDPTMPGTDHSGEKTEGINSQTASNDQPDVAQPILVEPYLSNSTEKRSNPRFQKTTADHFTDEKLVSLCPIKSFSIEKTSPLFTTQHPLTQQTRKTDSDVSEELDCNRENVQMVWSPHQPGGPVKLAVCELLDNSLARQPEPGRVELAQGSLEANTQSDEDIYFSPDSIPCSLNCQPQLYDPAILVVQESDDDVLLLPSSPMNTSPVRKKKKTHNDENSS